MLVKLKWLYFLLKVLLIISFIIGPSKSVSFSKNLLISPYFSISRLQKFASSTFFLNLFMNFLRKRCLCLSLMFFLFKLKYQILHLWHILRERNQNKTIIDGKSKKFLTCLSACLINLNFDSLKFILMEKLIVKIFENIRASIKDCTTFRAWIVDYCNQCLIELWTFNSKRKYTLIVAFLAELHLIELHPSYILHLI